MKKINKLAVNYCKIEYVYKPDLVSDLLKCDGDFYIFELIIPYDIYDVCELIQKEEKLKINKLKEFMLNENKVL